MREKTIRPLIFLFVLTLTLCFSAVVRGAEKDVSVIEKIEGAERAGKKKYAVIVGVDDYMDDNIFRDLDYAGNDAKAMAEIFGSEKGGLFFVKTLSTDQKASKFLPTRGNILNEIDRMLEFSQSGDTVLFYFSGHGAQGEDDEDYMLPMDSGIRPETNGISLKKLEEMFRKDDATVKMAFIDACRKNPYKDRSGVIDGLGYAFEVARGTFFMLSAESGKPSYEHKAQKMGLFSYAIKQALTVPGLADSNGDGVVSFLETKDYVMTKLRDLAYEAGVPAQLPFTTGEHVGDVVLSVPVKTADMLDTTEEVSAEPACVSKSKRVCLDGDAYWFDSCGNRENVADLCMAGAECVEGKCVCRAGYREFDGACVKAQSVGSTNPEEDEYNIVSPSCPAGYKMNWDGTQCVWDWKPPKYDPNSISVTVGGEPPAPQSPLCPDGYKMKQGKCWAKKGAKVSAACPDDMTKIMGKVCIDREQYRGSYKLGWDRSVNSALEAVCTSVGKRLCTIEEWSEACEIGLVPQSNIMEYIQRSNEYVVGHACWNQNGKCVCHDGQNLVSRVSTRCCYEPQ